MSLERYHNWWFNDYNRLDGRLRFIFYMMLLYFGSKSLLPVAAERLAACPESYFEAAGLMQLLIPASVTPQELATLLYFSQSIVIFFWICAAIGLFGRVSAMITGLGVFLFWGAMQSCAGTGHDWHLPMYSLIFLGLFSKNDRWSADYWLAARFNWYPFNDFTPDKYGGLARKLILVTTVFILFAGGIAKLFTGGFDWLNGESLYYYLVEFNEPSTAIGPLLLDFFLENRWIITILSVWTVLLELGSLWVLFRKKWRLFYVINLWAFHIGIYLLMFPRYFPSMICYLLIVNWRYTYNYLYQLYGRYVGKLPLGRKISLLLLETEPVKRHPENNTKLIFPSAIGVVFIVTIIFRIETFPLTYVPMYSTVLTEEKIGSFNRSDFNNLETLTSVAEQYSNGYQPWYLMFYYPRNIEIRLWYREAPGSEIQVKDVTEEYTYLIRNWTKWYQIVTDVTLSDMSENNLFGSDPENSLSKNTLAEIKSILVEQGDYDHIEDIALVYHFSDGDEEIMMRLD
ncbi:MAG: hypothetical protein WD604_16590 [Balneolaceae bacterium]